jgi:hypothetical protein
MIAGFCDIAMMGGTIKQGGGPGRGAQVRSASKRFVTRISGRTEKTPVNPLSR